MLAALPAAVALGVAVGVRAPSVSLALGPRRGPPDTIRAGRISIPRPPPVVQAPYLERAVARKSPREVAISELALRYNITGALARTIHDAAIEQGIDPELGFRLVRVESVFDVNAVGRGAVGLTQLMPGTARAIDPEVDTRRELLDPRTNLRLGFTNLREMIELFEGDVRLGVIAYNRGEVAVQRALRRGQDPENGYGRLVLGGRAHGGKPYAGTGLLEAPGKE
ncbi:MAG TPA: transglycosylase SLT domain-containing protein [Longimicrobiaceae bacterium]|nr:transglycosylase SLT domain-containing protein [Longimicrobiaceae bacterium]